MYLFVELSHHIIYVIMIVTINRFNMYYYYSSIASESIYSNSQ